MSHKYVIQYWKPHCSPGVYSHDGLGDDVGSWHNTAWGGDDLEKVRETVRQIETSGVGLAKHIYKVRILEIIYETKK